MRCTALLRGPVGPLPAIPRRPTHGKMCSLAGWICRRCRSPFGFRRPLDWNTFSWRRTEARFTNNRKGTWHEVIGLYDCHDAAGGLLMCRSCVHDLTSHRKLLTDAAARLGNRRWRSQERQKRAMDAWADLLACLAYLDEYKCWKKRDRQRLVRRRGWPFIQQHRHLRLGLAKE